MQKCEGLTGTQEEGEDFDVTHGTVSDKGQTSSRRPFTTLCCVQYVTKDVCYQVSSVLETV